MSEFRGHVEDRQAQPQRKGLRRIISKAARSRWALPFAGLLGFLEGSFIIVAMEPLFIPLMASRGQRAWLVSAFLLVGNVLGAVLMYGLGALLAEPLIEPLMMWLAGGEQAYHDTVERLSANGFAALFAIGITPFPFQVGTAAAGAIGFSLPLFLAAVTLSRGIRYFALGGLVMMIGARARDFIERHELEIFIAGVIIFAALSAFILFGNG